MDVSNNYPKDTERFFALSQDADPLLKRVVENLKEEEAQKPFVENYIKYEGYPIWKNARIVINKNTTNVEGGPDTLLSIPIVPDSALYVKGILKVKINNSILYKIYQRDLYASYGFDHNPDRTHPNADDIVRLIMLFENELFNYQNIFVIKDDRLFNNLPDTVPRPNPCLISVNKLEYCITTTMEYVICTEGCADDCKHYDYVTWYTSTTCVDIEDDGPWTGGGGSSSGGDGGRIPPAPPDPPCNGGWDRLTSIENGYWSGPCTEPTPIPPPPNTGPDLTPCDKTKKLKEATPTGDQIKLAFNQLKNSVYNPSNPPTPTQEIAISFTDEGQCASYTGPVISNGVDGQVNIPAIRAILGWIHTHPNITVDPAIVPMFSVGDFKAIYDAVGTNVNAQPNSPMIDFDTFVIGVTTGWGESYFLTIDNVNLFNSFAAQWLSNGDISELSAEYKRFSIKSTNSASTNEDQFLHFLSKNKVGATLFKANADFTQYTMLSLSGETVIASPCP